MQKQLNPLDGYEVAVSKPGVFVGTGALRGDKDTGHTTTLFQVNGDVIVRIFGVCTVDVAGASGTLEVGVTGNTAALIAMTTATDIDAGKIWSDTTPTLGVDTLASVLGPFLVVNGSDIIETVKTTDLSGGNIYYVCMWKPLTPGSNVIALPISTGATTRFDQ